MNGNPISCSGKKFFITGHTGFKGAWLVKTLLLAGADVSGYALAPPTKPSLYELAGLKKHIKSTTGDIRDLNRLVKILKKEEPETVIHMAAQPIVRESYKDPVNTYETNVMGTVNILEACRRVDSVRSIVNVTTDKVYENKEWDRGYKEEDILCGFDPYSNSKSCSELVTSGYRNSFYRNENMPPVSTARSGNVIGGGDFAPDRIIPDCVKAILDKKDIVVRNPRSVRPFQHVLECISGYLALAEKQYLDKKIAGAYNFGPGDEGCVTVGKLVDIFTEKWGNGLKRQDENDNGPHEAGYLKLACEKSNRLLGWKPAWTIETAVEKTVEWSREYVGKGDFNLIMEKQIKEYFSGV